MTKQELSVRIITDLGANFKSGDEPVINGVLEEIIEDALIISNRKRLATDFNGVNTQITLLASEITKAVKTIYLQRGSEDVNSLSKSGVSSSFANAHEVLRNDIIKNGKRLYA